MPRTLTFITMLISILLVACPAPTPSAPAVQSVTVSPENPTVQLGQTRQFSATVNVTGGAPQDVSWSSSNESVATISATGLLTSLSVGTTTVTATSTFDSSKSGTATVTVTAGTPVTVDCSTAQELSENITSDQTLPLDCFTVTTNITVSAALTLQPGTILQFNTNAGLRVADGGSLRAEGNATNPIRLTSSSGDPNDWRGIGFFTSSSNNVLSHVFIENAGRTFGAINGSNATNLYIADNATVAIRNSTFARSAGVGVYVNADSAELLAFENNSFVANNTAAMRITAKQLGEIGSGNTFSTDALPSAQHIQVAATTLRSSATWPAADVAYRFFGNTFIDDVGATITIQAGTRLEFNTNAGLRLNAGSLRALGTAENGITFTSASGDPNDWYGVGINSSSAQNLFEYVTIANAGRTFGAINGSRSTNLYIAANAQIAINNSTFATSSGRGIWVEAASAVLASFDNNTFDGNTAAPIRLYSNQLGRIGSGNTFGTNAPFAGRFVEVRGTDITTSQTWQNLDIPYRFFENHFINDPAATVTIEPGTTLQFDGNSGLRVNAGALSAIGTASERITFTSASGSTGGWRGIGINSGSSSNALRFVRLENAGRTFGVINGGRSTNLYVSSIGVIAVTETGFTGSSGHGIYMDGGSITDADGTAVAGADAAAFEAALVSLGNSFSGNASGAVRIP